MFFDGFDNIILTNEQEFEDKFHITNNREKDEKKKAQGRWQMEHYMSNRESILANAKQKYRDKKSQEFYDKKVQQMYRDLE